jgi:hypothetical protein
VTRNQEEAAALTYNMRNWRMGAMEAEEGVSSGRSIGRAG